MNASGYSSDTAVRYNRIPLSHGKASSVPFATIDGKVIGSDNPVSSGSMDVLPLHPKSFVALQELQNEVGALLEFRDLVIETFPNLRSRMSAANSANSSASSSTLATANGHHHLHHHGMAPGVGVSGTTNGHLSHQSRTADWESGTRVRRRPIKEQQKCTQETSVNGGIQDSGFSTDAASTSSKESSSTTPSATHSTGVVHGPGPGQGANVALDELWSLLDVIHRKGTRLRDEAQQLQQQQASSWTPGDQLPIQASNEQNGIHLQNGGAEASRLRIALDEALRQRDALDQELRKLRLSSNEEQYEKDREDDEKKLEEEISSRILDDALGPLQLPLKVEPPDRNWVKAVLLENSALSLKRHLLNALANNKTLLHRLEISDRARRVLEDTIAKYREEVDDLHFQLEEKNIELEGTRARIRILENKTINRYSSSTNVVLHGKDITHNDGFKPISNSNQGQLIVVKTPASPYSSSTESAHDVDTNHNGFNSTSPKHRPSRIPLPGHSRTASTTPSKLNVSPNRSLSRDSCRSASSIPIAKTPHTTMRNLSSPVPRLKRDSLTGRIRNHDSLSRVREKNLISSNKNVSTLHKNAGSNTHLVSDKVRQQKMPFWSNWFKMLDSGGQ